MKANSSLRLLSLLALAWLASAAPLLALDSLHLACVGHINVGDSASMPGSKGVEKFALTYDDQRAGKMGDKRRVKITMSLNGGNRIGVSDQVSMADINKVVLRNGEDKNDVLFRGTVHLVDDAENLLVDGEFTSTDKQTHHIHTKLTCYNVVGIWYGQNLKVGD